MRPPRTLLRAVAALLVLSACSVEDSPTEIDPTPPAATAGMSSGSAGYPAGHDFVVVGAYCCSWNAGTLLPSNGDGTFGEVSTFGLPSRSNGLDVADFDGDGDNDFLACVGLSSASSTPGGTVRLYTNDGTGSFSSSVVATGVTTFLCTNLREGDFNEDGLRDFVVGDHTATAGMFVHLQTPQGTFAKVTPGLDVASWNTIGGNALFGVAAGDVDGDSHEDVLALGNGGDGAGQVRFYKGDGTGAMAASTLLFNVNTDFGVVYPTALALLDVEGDGDLDIVVGGGSDGGPGGRGTHFVYINDGAGSFTRPAWYAFDVNSQTGVDAFDFDGDGDHDLVVAAAQTSSLFYVKNRGGVFASPSFVGEFRGQGIAVGAPHLVENKAPVADAGEAQVVERTSWEGALVALDGSGSYDPDGTIVWHEWLLDGDVIAEGATPTVPLPLGNHTLTIRVIDDQGAEDTDDVVVDVRNAPPTANAGEDQTVVRTSPEGVWVTLDGSASSDVDGEIVLYEWLLDGNVVGIGERVDLQLPAGRKPITLRVTDDLDATDTDEVVVTVLNAIPVADAGADQRVLVTLPVTFVASASDVDGWIDSYRWDMGDGTIIENDIATHVYTVVNPIGYDVVLTVTDNDGDEGVARAVKAFVLTPDEVVEDMIKVINRLEDTEGLTTNDANLLRGRLNEVLGFLAKDAYTQAEDKLHSFIRGVETRASIGRLDEAVAAELIQDAEDVISVIGT